MPSVYSKVLHLMYVENIKCSRSFIRRLETCRSIMERQANRKPYYTYIAIPMQLGKLNRPRNIIEIKTSKIENC